MQTNTFLNVKQSNFNQQSASSAFVLMNSSWTHENTKTNNNHFESVKLLKTPTNWFICLTPVKTSDIPPGLALESVAPENDMMLIWCGQNL